MAQQWWSGFSFVSSSFSRFRLKRFPSRSALSLLVLFRILPGRDVLWFLIQCIPNPAVQKKALAGNVPLGGA